MTIAVDLGRKATKPINNKERVLLFLIHCFLCLDLYVLGDDALIS